MIIDDIDFSKHSYWSTLHSRRSLSAFPCFSPFHEAFNPFRETVRPINSLFYLSHLSLSLSLSLSLFLPLPPSLPLFLYIVKSILPLSRRLHVDNDWSPVEKSLLVCPLWANNPSIGLATFAMSDNPWRLVYVKHTLATKTWFFLSTRWLVERER